MAATRKPLILVVDDTEDARDLCAEYLQFHDFLVETAHDGQEAIRKALAVRPDLILMDLSMPIMDGWQATRWLKANEQTCAIPVVAFTAHAMVISQMSALEAGCDEVVTKPVLPNDLVRVLRQVLARTGASN
ncbi:MAG TPA: response regulator [Thermoanaerobaculia bacterium]|nr:response regulator [Thermoanaerobaculia bacterium]